MTNNLNEQTNLTKCFCAPSNTDDECFYVGLGHRGQSQTARKSNFLGSDEYRPFQCCPTKLERATKVPKMTAQRLAPKNPNDRASSKSGHFEFSAEPTKTARAEELSKASAKKTTTTTTTGGNKAATLAKGTRKHVELKDDKPERKSASAAKKDKKDPKTGQKGLLGIGKVVDWL